MILGASRANVLALEEFAKLRDTECIVLDGSPDSAAKSMFSDFQVTDITDPRAVLSVAEHYRIDGIYSMNDHALRSASVVSTHLRLRGLSPAAAHAALDKGTMREVWRSAGIRQPEFKIIFSMAEIEPFGAAVGYPIVIKPVDCGGGGRGVYVMNSEQEIEAGYRYASQFLKRNNRMIVEKFIDGIESSIEYFSYAGRSCMIAYSDKYKPPLNSRVATKICYPGHFAESIIAKMEAVCRDATQALGIGEGVAHIECIVDPSGEVFMVELGARVGGGHTFHPIASHVGGLNYPKLIADYYCGRDVSVPLIDAYKGAAYFFTYSERAGTLREVQNLHKAMSVENIALVELWKKPGDSVDTLVDSMARTGCIVALGPDRDKAVYAAERSLGDLKFILE